MTLDALDRELLKTIADLHDIPSGAVNIRKDGQGIERKSTKNITIEPKQDKSGINIYVAPNTRNEAVHFPVLLTLSGITDVVYNTIEIGENSDVILIAGCGIHNPGSKKSQHDGIHEIRVKKGAKMKYIEKHFGGGEGKGERVLNPKTVLVLEENSIAEMELTQLKGVDSTVRVTDAIVKKGGKLVITERLLTHGDQEAISKINIILEGEGASAEVISRSVAKENSKQIFKPEIIARAKSRGHVVCDSIIMENGKISSSPAISAEHPDAELTHEAAIGKIAQDQLLKLMTLGLSEDEAVDVILRGFLK
ncbi:SufB/SufD family protein [Thermovenabulum gondwanense]|uniref:FeS cluster assembly protein SufB n=1 Tax=Thermovenabulum gondwanense TaxID=520767 RepID=A0A161Q9Y5_9FIRM|nr:SufD family Fe-S cluster assembly protein [Thermovenabulum gondwanense]KYO64746.1 FeS cluster assembly protein SufB [Thermovenabulum gondwanense]